jgi:hypothetical protein
MLDVVAIVRAEHPELTQLVLHQELDVVGAHLTSELLTHLLSDLPEVPPPVYRCDNQVE